MLKIATFAAALLASSVVMADDGVAPSSRASTTGEASDWDALASIEPGSLLVEEATKVGVHKTWFCRVVSEEEYASGRFPGGTECHVVAPSSRTSTTGEASGEIAYNIEKD